MSDRQQIAARLVDMSRELGRPEADNAILGEGNTSARLDDETFLVKASGTQLATIDEAGFCRVRFGPVLEMLDAPSLTDDEVKDGLFGACVGQTGLRPSVETVLHAALLGLEGVAFVGHTHPAAVNAVLCSRQPEALSAGRLFPDEIVVCGPASVFVPYVDPGPPLARAVRDGVAAYVAEWAVAPKVVLMQNHGLIALGASDREVVNITMMATKAARVLLGTYALGGPGYMTEQQASRIYTRPDEKYRQAVLAPGE